MRKYLRIAALVAILGIVAAACGGGDGGGGGGGEGGADIPRGGTLRGAIGEGSDFFYALDPQQEYYSLSWEFLSRGLARTLYGYTGKPAEEGGSAPQLDLAASVEASADGLTYTFTLKDGIKFGNPLNREIVAADFVTAFARFADPNISLQTSYPFYFTGVIEGFQEAQDAGDGSPVSGVTAIDDKTLEIKLVAPNADLPFLLAMPATSPLPAELVAAHPEGTTMGQFLVSSGPYEFEGYTDLATMEGDTPPSGMNFGSSYVLVRNPSWDAATDPLRPAYVDRIEVAYGGEAQDLLDKVAAGDIDICFDCGATATTLAAYQADPALQDRIRVYGNDVLYYRGLNVYEPPVDDIHVRKALNLIWPRAELRTLGGGEIQGDYATHFIPPSLMGGLGADYQPYETPDFKGDVAAAQAEMKLSAYDANQDGKCDDPACQDMVYLIISGSDVGVQSADLIAERLTEIGIVLDIKQVEYGTLVQKCATLEEHQTICQAGWGKDYPSAYTFFYPLLDQCANGSNYAFLGCTAEELEAAGYTVPASGPIAISDQITECAALAAGSDEQNQCYFALDQYVMEEIVPVIPTIFGRNIDVLGANIVNYSYDQFAGMGALDHYAVAGSASPSAA
ncbi:MAG: ABC transporter substrate-binding protein [Actinomycetota bacterium]